MTNIFSAQPLVCRKPGGEYTHLSSTLLNNRLLFDIIADDFGQLWIAVANGGIVVADFNGTPDITSDDRYISYTTTPGSGGLPTNGVTTLAKDNSGYIWIGTTEGIAVVYCPGGVFDRRCDADRICIPRTDNPSSAIYCWKTRSSTASWWMPPTGNGLAPTAGFTCYRRTALRPSTTSIPATAPAFQCGALTGHTSGKRRPVHQYRKRDQRIPRRCHPHRQPERKSTCLPQPGTARIQRPHSHQRPAQQCGGKDHRHHGRIGV